MASCSRCFSHLGWSFSPPPSEDPEAPSPAALFLGLILTHLRERSCTQRELAAVKGGEAGELQEENEAEDEAGEEDGDDVAGAHFGMSEGDEQQGLADGTTEGGTAAVG